MTSFLEPPVTLDPNTVFKKPIIGYQRRLARLCYPTRDQAFLRGPLSSSSVSTSVKDTFEMDVRFSDWVEMS